MMSGTSSRFAFGFQVLVGLVGAVYSLVGTVAAQEATPSKPEAAANASVPGENKKVLIAYPLNYVDGKDVLQCVRTFSPEAQVTIDSTRKRVIVFASHTAHQRLMDLLKKIDVPPAEEESQLKVFSLVNANASSMSSLLSRIASNKEVKIAADLRTNSLLAVGPPDQLQVIAALLMSLDEKSDRELHLPNKTYRVRIVWFAEGPPNDKAVKLDNGLQVVQDELSRIGIKAIRQMGQTMVSAAPQGDFNIGCSVVLGDGPADLEINGNLDMRRETPHLKIEISVGRDQALADRDAGTTRPVQVVNLATEIIAPLGHYVVLGVTPVQEKTLAFAVQVR